MPGMTSLEKEAGHNMNKSYNILGIHRPLKRACVHAKNTMDYFPSLANFYLICGVAVAKSPKEAGIEAANQVYISLMNPNSITPMSDLALKIKDTMSQYDRGMLTADKIERMRHGWASIGEQMAKEAMQEKLVPTALAIESKINARVPIIDEKPVSVEFRTNTVSRLSAIRLKIAGELT